MRAYATRLLIVSTATLALGVASAHAQFGFPGLPSPRGLPLPLPGVRVGPGVVPLPLPGLYGRNGLGRTFGIIGAVAVGAVILHRLSVHDRREVTRRARVVVERNQEERVVDTYNSKDGRHQVTVIADPVRKASEFVDDPALQKIADTKQQENVAPPKPDPKAKGKAAGKQAEEDLVKITDLPQDSSCRRVTTEYEGKAPPAPANAKTKAPEPTTSDAKQTNVSIMCRTQSGTWKPAAA